MSEFLVVKTLDVNYNPHKASRVEVTFTGSAGRQTMAPAGPTGVFEIQIPNDVDEMQVGVEEPGFFPVGQGLRLKRKGPGPVLEFQGNSQELNVRNVDTHSRGGGDFSVELYVVLSQLQDAKSNVDAVNDKFKIGFRAPLTFPVIDFSGLTVINTSGGTGWNQFNQSPIPAVTPRGTLLYAERTTVPKLVAIWVPDGVTVTRERDKVNPGQVPLNFHLFYHPSPGVLRGNYPFDNEFVFLIARYLLCWKIKHKQMTNQHQASGSRAILVFPVGDPAGWNGALGNGTSILRLLQEAAWFIQRKHRIPFPLQPVGRCAVSGFSAGGQYVARALAGDNAFFHDTVLTEIYGFDIRTPMADFAARLKSWWRGGADNRKFRMYTTAPDHFTALEGVDPKAALFQGAGGAKERQGIGSTVVLLPVFGFWTSLHPESPPDTNLFQTFQANFDDVHQMFPGLFVQHALKNSSL